MLKPRINHQITAPELRVISENGENIGVMSREDALKLANPAGGIDLIEIVPHAEPPVARVMSFDKFRYLREKEEKKQRQAQKAAGLKQVQFTARSAENDQMVRVRQLEKFLNEGHTVEVQMKLRGREKGMKDWQQEQLQGFLGRVGVEYKIIMAPHPGGRGIIMQVARKSAGAEALTR